jgi:Toxin with a H, D/N and C signature
VPSPHPPLTTLTSLATETQGAERAGGLYGWMSESASSYRGLRTKVGWGYTRTTYKSSDGALRVDSYAGRAALIKKAPGRLLGKFRAEWSAFPNTNGGTNYLADAEISGRDIRRLMRSVEKSGNTQPITILSGVHGNELGKNWKTGRRRYPEPLFYAGDLASESEFASLAGRPDHSVKVTNLAKLSQADYLRLTDSNSIIVHGYCFGVADWPFMRKHNVSRATTYRV